jgi:thiol-disulfide isomerase/thioredoxin
MNLSQNFIKLAFACGICLLITACSTSPSGQNSQLPSTPVSNQAPPTAKPMPPMLASSHGEQTENNAGSNLIWRLVNGQTKTVAGYRGKVLILDFWATYCPPCEEEIPHLVELSSKYSKDLHVVGLHVGGDEDKPNIAGFVSRYKMSYDLGYPDQNLMDFYLQGDDRIPQTLVFDRQGQLMQKFVGFTPEIKADLDNAVNRALKIQ